MAKDENVPALWKRMSTRPNRSTQAVIALAQSSSDETSHAWNAAFSIPSLGMMSRSSRSARKTLAPSWRKSAAVARPRPEVPPVIRATWSVNLTFAISESIDGLVVRDAKRVDEACLERNDLC